MSRNFEPSNAFEGYVCGKLEAIESKMADLPCSSRDERFRKLETQVANMEGKATIVGGISGAVVGVLMSFIKRFI